MARKPNKFDKSNFILVNASVKSLFSYVEAKFK